MEIERWIAKDADGRPSAAHGITSSAVYCQRQIDRLAAESDGPPANPDLRPTPLQNARDHLFMLHGTARALEPIQIEETGEHGLDPVGIPGLRYQAAMHDAEEALSSAADDQRDRQLMSNLLETINELNEWESASDGTRAINPTGVEGLWFREAYDAATEFVGQPTRDASRPPRTPAPNADQAVVRGASRPVGGGQAASIGSRSDRSRL